MPQRHQYSELPEDLAPDRRALAEVIRGLIRASGKSYKQLAEESLVSKSLLYAYANGKRKRSFDPSLLQPLHAVASTSAAEHGIQVLSWAGFKACCLALGRPAPEPGVCGECGAVCEKCAEAQGAGTVDASGKPADTGVGTGLEPSAALPVPQAEGDRQVRADVFWPHISVLQGHLAAGSLENATGLLRSAGLHGPPEEAAEAVAACLSSGLEEAVDMLLRQASARNSSEVLQVVRRLNQVECRAESDVLLDMVLAGAGT